MALFVSQIKSDHKSYNSRRTQSFVDIALISCWCSQAGRSIRPVASVGPAKPQPARVPDLKILRVVVYPYPTPWTDLLRMHGDARLDVDAACMGAERCYRRLGREREKKTIVTLHIRLANEKSLHNPLNYLM